MRVLLTGASSFTGFWFARALAQGGHEVMAPLRGALSDYVGIRSVRARQLTAHAAVVERCAFGSEAFLALVREQDFDVLCHHAAEVANYRSLDFDAAAAAAANTCNLRRVLETMQERTLKAVVATGTVFEPDEGIGEHPRRAFFPYGLSKGLTWQIVRYWCDVLGVPLGKFVIANPFGPFEEKRFCAYLVERWRAGEVAEVRTPQYLRDNIHVDLLALAYAAFAAHMADSRMDSKLGVSGYRETQGAFATRVAAEMRARVSLECRLVMPQQAEFLEPMVRINQDLPDPAALGWDETKAWDGLATYYFGGGSQPALAAARPEAAGAP